MQSCFPLYFSSVVASSLNMLGWWHVWSDCYLLNNPWEGLCDCFHLHYQAVVETVLAALSLCMVHLAWQWSPPLAGLCDWAISVQYKIVHTILVWVPFLFLGLLCACTHTYAVCCLMRSMNSDSLNHFACWSFLRQWECLPEFSGRNVSYRCQNQFLGFLELCQLAYLLSWIDSSAWPIQDLPAQVCIRLCLSCLYGVGCGDFLQHWRMLWPVSLSVCLVCISGRSSMNCKVSWGVSLVVPSITGIASFCTLSSFSRFVCDKSTPHCPFFGLMSRVMSWSVVPPGHIIQLLHCFGCRPGVPSCFVCELIICQCQYLSRAHFGSVLPDPWYIHCRGLAAAAVLVVGPLWADEEHRSSFHAA